MADGTQIKADSVDAAKQYVDNYTNLITGLGTARDKSSYSGHKRATDLSRQELDSLYEQDAISARIVDRLPDDATREGIFLTGADEEFDWASVQSEIEDLQGVTATADAWRWSRLYGGSLLFMNINDGLTMDQPLDLKAATNLSSLQIIESPYVEPANFDPGLGARAFRNPTWYNVNVAIGAGRIRRIHRTRVIRFEGTRVPPTRIVERGGWGPSVLDRVRTETEQLGDVLGYSRNVMHTISQKVLRLTNLRNMLCGSDEDQAQARALIQSISDNADNLHWLVVDKADEFIEVNRNVSGLEALIDKFVDALVRATDMPRTVILGEQPGGLNASGDSEMRAWFDYVSSQQRIVLTPAINRLLHIIFAIRANNGEQVPDEWVINYKPLWQPTAQENADTYLKLSQGDAVYMEHDVVSSDEVRARLISQGLASEPEPSSG